jgi:cytochrome o ubiquinol oxidase subunit 2
MRVNKKYKFIIFSLLAVLIVSLIVAYFRHHNIAVLDAKGPIGRKERNLFWFGLALSAVVVIPVYAMTIGIIWKYRESNTHAKAYRPDWDGSRLLEGIWWGIPCAIILVLSVVTWNSSYGLDPHKPLASTVPALNVDVIALDWKWLFVYPEQNVASVNVLQLPVDTPVNFSITSDSVMNSFWIPNLGGQIYAMPGMTTELHLLADTPGDYRGSSANISGRGFARMAFTARASQPTAFRQWVNQAKQSPASLSMATYEALAKPGETAPMTYAGVNSNLYTHTVLKYMGPAADSSEAME